MREALEFSDVCRLHGRAVAASVWGKLSAMGRATYEDSTFQRMLRCRSTWELDRCTAEEISGCSALQSGELTNADLFRVCATRLCLNAARATGRGTTLVLRRWRARGPYSRVLPRDLSRLCGCM